MLGRVGKGAKGAVPTRFRYLRGQRPVAHPTPAKKRRDCAERPKAASVCTKEQPRGAPRDRHASGSVSLSGHPAGTGADKARVPRQADHRHCSPWRDALHDPEKLRDFSDEIMRQRQEGRPEVGPLSRSPYASQPPLSGRGAKHMRHSSSAALPHVARTVPDTHPLEGKGCTGV